jgi:NAD(P)-dependent dehydrogenase (short-subunit alcohol dehydrogenase family)
MQKTWFIAGASRGLGLAVAKAALDAGDWVVAASRNRETAARALAHHNERLLCVDLDVTRADAARVAADQARARFGSVDVLVNGAGYGHHGFFEELALQDARDQIETNLFGALNVTWAILPSMRAARKGRIFNVSSIGGFMGGQMASLYCASKFALEGFSESLAKEVAPFNVQVILVEPGPFRTDFLTAASSRFEHAPIADYDDRRAQFHEGIAQRNGKQPGDPAKFAQALLHLADAPAPPLRFVAGSIAVGAAKDKLASLEADLNDWQALSLSTDGAWEQTDLAALRAQIR